MKTTIEFQNYVIELDEVPSYGWSPYVARAHRIAPKARFGHKHVFAYRFSSIEARAQYIANFRQEVERQIAEKVARREVKSNARKNMKNPFKVGDMLYDSWGYEQTNINFYQVVEVGEKSVTIQEIGQRFVSGEPGWAEHVAPVKDAFIGEPIKKLIQVSVYNDKANYYINSKFRGSLSPVTERHMKEGIYQSHYA